ncbi:hypothetical protein [Cardinium endosymbiont of Culicoides punctatus]|nr:hypothetical protein [Cardinium endosymbiont of Culicoides punctatus]
MRRVINLNLRENTQFQKIYEQSFHTNTQLLEQVPQTCHALP